MASYDSLINLINAYIKQNGVRAITGNILNGVLNNIVAQIGSGYVYKGTAAPDEDPGVTDIPVAYITATAGTYTNFGGLEVASGELAILRYDGTSWSKETVITDLYQIPQGGIPATDLSQAVQDSLGLADTSLQPGDINEEDLTIDQAKGLQFANRVNGVNTNGMGYKILRKDATFASQVTDTNTIYEIRYDFNLDGTTFSLPAKCVLVFEGGKLSNGTLEGDNSVIDASAEQIFNTNLTLSGTWNINKAFPEWYGAVADGVTDCTAAIQKLDGFPIYFSGGTYIVSNVILHRNTLLIGCGIEKTIIKQKPNSVDDMIILQDWFGGCMRDLSVRADATATLSGNGFQTALVKMRSEKRTPNNTYNYYASIDNVLINGAGASNTFNGLSLLGANQVDNGFVCAANWVFHISNIWIRHCGGYGLYDAGSDNLFNTLDIGSCGFAHIYEKGSSNMWVNAKLDGNIYTIPGTAEEIFNMEDKGALLIVKSSGVLSMLGFDLQDCKYCGVKFIECSDSRFEISANYIGSGADVADIAYSKNFYIKTLTRSMLKLVVIPYTNQVSTIGIYRFTSVYQNIIDIIGTLKDDDNEVVKQLIGNNIVNLANSITTSTRRKLVSPLSNNLVLHNIFAKTIAEDTDQTYFSYSNITRETTSPVFANTPYLLFDNSSTQVLRGLTKPYPQKQIRKESMYVAAMVVRIDQLPTGTGEIYPYINLNFGGKSPVISLTKRTRNSSPSVGDIYVEAYMFSFCLNSEISNEFLGLGSAVFLAAASNGKFSIANFCLYEITDLDFKYLYDFDIISSVAANSAYTTDLILKINGNKSLNSLSMDSVSRENLFSNANRRNRGSLIFDSTFKEWVYFDGTDWISATTGLKLAKRSGAFSAKPTFSADTNAGFQYYDTTNNRFIFWNGTAWVNMDGSALS